MHIRRNAIFRSGLVVLVLFCGNEVLRGNQDQKAPSKELVQYVRDASRLGLKDSQIQQNAIKAGWPATVVNEAIASVAAARQTPIPEAQAPVASNSSTPAAPPQQPAGPPANQPLQSAQDAESSKTHGVPDDYRIGAGDVLQISVWKEPDASVPVAVVRPDGKIGLPLLKEVEVVGLTPAEAEKLITSRIVKYIPAADVTVVVKDINSKKIYIVGAVKKEGPIPYNYRMTVMQALSEAGGLSDYAKRKKIYVLRTQNGKDYRLPFDYEAVLKGERMELNIPLLPNDTLVIPH